MKMSIRNRVYALATCCFIPAQMFADVSGTNPHPQHSLDALFKILFTILGR